MRIAADHLMEAIIILLQTLGAEDKEARLVAKALVQADMRGIHTHGCAYVPLIAERCAHGLFNIPTKTKLITDEGAIAHIDGNNGLDQIAAVEAMQISIHKARNYGVALALIRNTNHIVFRRAFCVDRYFFFSGDRHRPATLIGFLEGYNVFLDSNKRF